MGNPVLLQNIEVIIKPPKFEGIRKILNFDFGKYPEENNTKHGGGELNPLCILAFSDHTTYLSGIWRIVSDVSTVP